MEFFEKLGALGTSGLVLGFIFLLWQGTKLLNKLIEKRGGNEMFQQMTEALVVIKTHLEQFQRSNEGNDKTLQTLNNTIITMTGIVENMSVNVSKLLDACNSMNTAIAILTEVRRRKQ